jgi:hypothetical protein
MDLVVIFLLPLGILVAAIMFVIMIWYRWLFVPPEDDFERATIFPLEEFSDGAISGVVLIFLIKKD